MELFIDPGFRRLIPQLSTEERRQLEDNLLRDGRRDPVVADRTTRALVGRRDRQGRSEPKRTSRAGKDQSNGLMLDAYSVREPGIK